MNGRAAFAILLLAACHAHAANPVPSACDAVDSTLTTDRAAMWAPLVERHLKSPTPPVDGIGVFDPSARLNVRLNASLRTDGWTVLLFETDLSDAGYLFYRAPPESGKFVGVWGGVWPRDPDDPDADAKALRQLTSQVTAAMPDLPSRLAECFAQHALMDRYR